MVTFTPVKSNNLKEVAYSDRKLYVRFHSSAQTYVYQMVPPVVFDGLLKAESKGKFLNEMIINYFDYEILDE